ncbi:MAG: TolC family protein [Burkholderiaceae bacterium]
MRFRLKFCISAGLHPRAHLRALCLALAAAGVWTACAAQTPPPVLPPEASVRAVLASLPQVRAAAAGMDLAQARKQRLAAGPHDWVAKTAYDRRVAPQGQRFNEEEIGVETGLRWPGKLRTDEQIGEAELQIGQFAYADAWHEAARTLLRDWFDALRELHSAKVLQAQAELAQAQLSAIERRVQAGEAAKLDTLAAQAEAARIQAQAVRSRAQAQLLQQALQRQYPGLPLPSDAGLEEAALDGTDIAVADWAQKILADNHELELAQARAAQARLQARRAEQERTGDPTVGVRARRERSGEERIWGAYLSIPLGSAGRRADAEAAAAQAEMAQQEYERTRQRVSTDAWRAASEAQQTRTTWQQLRHAWQQIAQSAQLQARAYELGESPLADLLLARRNALEAQLAADAAALDGMQAQARLLLDAHHIWAAPEEGAH